MLSEDFDNSASKVHSRKSVTKESSFEILSHDIQEKEDCIDLPDKEKTKNSFPKRDENIGFNSCKDKKHDNGPNEENPKEESILLIEEKQYRLIKAKGHFKI